MPTRMLISGLTGDFCYRPT